MTASELRAILAIAAIFALRMLGLFMVLPLFSLYANNLPGVTPTLLGLAMGSYGVTQAILQIPFGSWSDRLGRKPIIALGLMIFAIGSSITAFANTIYGVILGRALQGAGAVGSATIALAADVTRPEQRTKAMALIGITIGGSFSLAMILGPLLHTWLTIPAIFLLCAAFALFAMIILYTLIPTPATDLITSTTYRKNQFKIIVTHPELLRHNFGIFILHAILTASFVVIPFLLKKNIGLESTHQWQLYLPVFAIAALITLLIISLAEKKHYTKKIFLWSIGILSLTQLLLQFSDSLISVTIILIGFFSAFSILEANLPSLISRDAPTEGRGLAMGIYSTCQFFGIFLGGLLGGWLMGHYDVNTVFMVNALAALVWLTVAAFMQDPNLSSRTQRNSYLKPHRSKGTK